MTAFRPTVARNRTGGLDAVQTRPTIAAEAGLILVDTKYEMGLINGKLALIDEIHTPDSSRYWVAESYQPGTEPENFDKEFMRLWFAAQGYRGDGTPPTMPDEFVAQIAARYIAAYEKLTGQEFVTGEQPVVERIAKNLLQRNKG